MLLFYMSATAIYMHTGYVLNLWPPRLSVLCFACSNITSFSDSCYVALTEGRELSYTNTACSQLCDIHNDSHERIENGSANYAHVYWRLCQGQSSQSLMLTTDLHVVLKMNGCILPVPPTPSWHGRGQFYLNTIQEYLQLEETNTESKSFYYPLISDLSKNKKEHIILVISGFLNSVFNILSGELQNFMIWRCFHLQVNSWSGTVSQKKPPHNLSMETALASKTLYSVWNTGQ